MKLKVIYSSCILREFRAATLEFELAIVFALFAALAVYLFVKRVRRWIRRFKNGRRTRRYNKKHAPFDSESSKPRTTDRVLSGRAYIIDGDSIVIRKTQIRLYGIDAPEIDHPYGQKAKWALVSLCKGKTIRAEITEQDVHGRTVAKCFLQDGRDLSAEMVKIGLAIDWPKYSQGRYKSLEVPNVRRKLWLADARQKGRMHIWEQFEARNKRKT